MCCIMLYGVIWCYLMLYVHVSPPKQTTTKELWDPTMQRWTKILRATPKRRRAASGRWVPGSQQRLNSSWTGPDPDPTLSGSERHQLDQWGIFSLGVPIHSIKRNWTWWFSIAISSYDSYVKLPGGSVCMIKPWKQSYTIYFYYQL